MHNILVCSLLSTCVYSCAMTQNSHVHSPLIVPNIHCSHPWEKMAEAAFRKYPNPHSGNVHTLDTIERRVTATGELFSHRIFGTLWNIPTIALNVCFVPNGCCIISLVCVYFQQIIGTNPMMRVNEQSLCDPHAKTLTISAKNVITNESVQYMYMYSLFMYSSYAYFHICRRSISGIFSPYMKLSSTQ